MILIKEMIFHLFFFVIFMYMEGKIHRVTYNIGKQEAELHLSDGTTKTVPMTEEEWKNVIQGNIIENLKKYLNE